MLQGGQPQWNDHDGSPKAMQKIRRLDFDHVGSEENEMAVWQ